MFLSRYLNKDCHSKAECDSTELRYYKKFIEVKYIFKIKILQPLAGRLYCMVVSNEKQGKDLGRLIATVVMSIVAKIEFN